MTTAAAVQNKQNFDEGIRLVFASWTAMQLAVANELGGPDSAEKSQWMLEQITDLFSTKGAKIDVDDLIDFVGEMCENEFEMILEDGSLDAVCSMLYRLFNECIHGKTDCLCELRRFSAKAAASNAVQQSVALATGDDEELVCSDDEEEEEDALCQA